MPRHVGLALVAFLAFGVMTTPAAAPGGNSANAKACQKARWMTFVTTTGESFASGEACTSYGAQFMP